MSRVERTNQFPSLTLARVTPGMLLVALWLTGPAVKASLLTRR